MFYHVRFSIFSLNVETELFWDDYLRNVIYWYGTHNREPTMRECKMKKTILLSIILPLIINCLIIFNYDLNKDEKTSGIQYREYKEFILPEPLQSSEDSITQYFIPEGLKMTNILIRIVASDSDLFEKNNASINLTLRDDCNRVIKTEEIAKEQINNWHYYDFKVSDLRIGKKYSIAFAQTKGSCDKEGKFLFSCVPFIYSDTEKGKNYPAENIVCEYNGEEQSYQMDLFYVYEVPLFWKILPLIGINAIIWLMVGAGNYFIKKYNLQRKAMLVFLWVSPILQFIVVECITGNLCKIQPLYWVINILIYYAILGLFLLFFKSTKTCLIATYVLNTVAALIQYYVYKLRGRSFMLQDIKSVRTAGAVMGAYSFDIELKAGVALLIVVGMFYIIATLTDIKNTKYILQRRISTAVILAGILCVITNGSIMEQIDLFSLDMWDPESNYKEKGYMCALISEGQFLKVEKPDNYSEEKIENIAAYYAEDYEKREKQDVVIPENVILIMNESWADFRYLEEFEQDNQITPYIDNLKEDTIKGWLHVPVFGGGTANSEYEVLTGNTMQFLSNGSTAYQLYVSEQEWGLASIFNSQGYKTMSYHPQQALNWNRNIVYPHMQFEEFYFLENWPEEIENIRWCPSDKTAYQPIMETHGNLEEDEKMFSFLVTMQNHGGYDWEDFEETVNLNLGEDMPLTEQYLSLIQISDLAFQELVEYFEKIEKPTMIVMFGDHLPNIDIPFYEALLGENWDDLSLLQKQKIHTTPFVIWCNYDIEEEQDVEMSSNYFGSYLLELAGVEMPDYNKCLLKFREQIPVIGLGMVKGEDGEWYAWNDVPDEMEKVMQDYEILQYNNIFGRRKRIDSIFCLN